MQFSPSDGGVWIDVDKTKFDEIHAGEASFSSRGIIANGDWERWELKHSIKQDAPMFKLRDPSTIYLFAWAGNGDISVYRRSTQQNENDKYTTLDGLVRACNRSPSEFGDSERIALKKVMLPARKLRSMSGKEW